MTADREQVRRDAPLERKNARNGLSGCDAIWPFDQLKAYYGMKEWAEYLLAELEQAERRIAFAEEQAVEAAEGHGRMSAKLAKTERERDDRTTQLEDELQQADHAYQEGQRRAWAAEARLVKVEQERDEALDEVQALATEKGIRLGYEARLATVPALVEAAKRLPMPVCNGNLNLVADRALWDVHHALTVYEQSQGKP